MLSESAIDALNKGQHRDPFAVLGPHREKGRRVVRAFQPGIQSLQLVSTAGTTIGTMQRVPGTDLFEG